MFSNPFFHDLYVKYIASFGAMFDQIYIKSGDGLIKVPLSYGPREKVLAPVKADPNHDRIFSAQLPRMSYEATGIRYSTTRKLNSMNRITVKDDSNGSAKSMYESVPYDINFTLSAFVKNREDGHRILEQILPNFSPAFVLNLALIPEMDAQPMQIPVTLTDVQTIDEWMGNYEQRQMTMWQFSFTMEARFFGPVRTSKIIKFANTQFFPIVTEPARDSVGVSDVLSRVTVRPGLTANGEPTTVLADSVPLSQISVDDDWAVIVTIEDMT